MDTTSNTTESGTLNLELAQIAANLSSENMNLKAELYNFRKRMESVLEENDKLVKEKGEKNAEISALYDSLRVKNEKLRHKGDIIRELNAKASASVTDSKEYKLLQKKLDGMSEALGNSRTRCDRLQYIANSQSRRIMELDMQIRKQIEDDSKEFIGVSSEVITHINDEAKTIVPAENPSIHVDHLVTYLQKRMNGIRNNIDEEDSRCGEYVLCLRIDFPNGGCIKRSYRLTPFLSLDGSAYSLTVFWNLYCDALATLCQASGENRICEKKLDD